MDVDYEQTRNGGSKVVLLPCSNRRYQEEGLAIEVYGIGAIDKLKQVIWASQYDENVDTYILSAKHGVIPIDYYIEPYDEQITQDRKEWVQDQVGEFLSENDYNVFYSFVDGIYQKAVNEVSYNRNAKWDFDTVMLQPCCRTAAMDGIDVLDPIIRQEYEIDPASEVEW
jgi:predicted RNA-binding protein